jgi:steroid 5-alpha reductase family enzyme
MHPAIRHILVAYATVVIFGFSRWFNNSSFYDAYWSIIPPLLALYWSTQRWCTAGQP